MNIKTYPDGETPYPRAALGSFPNYEHIHVFTGAQMQQILHSLFIDKCDDMIGRLFIKLMWRHSRSSKNESTKALETLVESPPSVEHKPDRHQ